ncbi:MAG: D-alanine--D-alanine ligase [Candidatus Aquicultorales bacterium]
MARKVAVLMGGRSKEREISLRTGAQVVGALERRGLEAVGIDVDENVVERLKREAPDVCFIALHGRFGEDGTIQGLLELMGLPYTGSGVLASALGIDKVATKRIFQADGIPTPAFAYSTKSGHLADPLAFKAEILAEVGLPAVIKPAREGSTIGMTIVHDEAPIDEALDLAFEHDELVLAERFVCGTEITVGIIGNPPRALPTLEIVTKTGMYDYQTKYTAGLADHIIPARLPEEQRIQAQEMAVKAHQALGCRGFSRVDFIIDEEGRAFVLEVNTIPGLTEVSLFPDAARADGLEFDELVESLVELALEG